MSFMSLIWKLYTSLHHNIYYYMISQFNFLDLFTNMTSMESRRKCYSLNNLIFIVVVLFYARVTVLGFGLVATKRRMPRFLQESCLLRQQDRVLFHRHDPLLVKSRTSNNQQLHPCIGLFEESTTSSNSRNTRYYFASQCPEQDVPGEEEKDKDWRSFRAHLVSNERNIMKNCESTLMSRMKKSWIHDSGLLECGTILLNHPAFSKNDRNMYRYALTEQWLHKSVVLVLECESYSSCSSHPKVTGILLNRPTDLILYDNVRSEDERGQNHGSDPNMESQPDWEVWFGGDEFGIHSERPKFFCLHSMTDSPEALALSNEVIPGIYFCSLQDAKELVSRGVSKCTSDDFWVFCGFQTWARHELEEELRDGLWHAIATDASLVEKGHLILKTTSGATRSDGDRTWKILMRLIGQRFHHSRDNGSSFSDKMLNEWCLNKLEFDEPPFFLQGDRAMAEMRSQPWLQSLLEEEDNPIKAGTLVQASLDCSKKLMRNQQFHCSTILILQDDDEMTVGTIISMPSQMGVDLCMDNDSGSLLFDKELVTLPLRYGGPLGGPCHEDHCENEPLFTFHLSSALRERNIGEPIGEDRNGIWKCSHEDLLYSIEHGIAFVEDFALVDGICVWQKKEDESGNIGEFLV